MKFKFGDIVEYVGESGYTVQGTVTRFNSEEFVVKWADNVVSTEQQDTTDNIRKVDSVYAKQQ